MAYSILRPGGKVESVINYIVKPQAAAQNKTKAGLENGEAAADLDAQIVLIRDMRQAEETFDLDTHGFTLSHWHCDIKDFTDHEHIMEVAEQATEELLKRVTGATSIHFIAYLYRKIDDKGDSEAAGNIGDGIPVNRTTSPARMAHVDQSFEGARTWAGIVIKAYEEANYPDYAAEFRRKTTQTRWAIMNVWTPVKPILREPLAVCDGRTVSQDDLCEGSYLGKSISGEKTWNLWHVAANPAHKWYWASHMQPGEALIFKNFDSKQDGRARLAPHTAFHLPEDQETQSPMRQSIEVRTFVFWENEPAE